MHVLCMMECSGRVRDAMIARGHDAISCDILDTETPGPHSTLHWWEFLERYPRWDLMIAHPPCTYLAVSGNKWLYHPDDWKLPVAKRRPHPLFPNRKNDRAKAIKVVEALWEHRKKQIKKVVIENPVGRLPALSRLGPATQIIQPWWFGDPEKKATCLWEHFVDPLIADYASEEEFEMMTGLTIGQSTWKEAPGPERQRNRSRTFQGFANAMARQWG